MDMGEILNCHNCIFYFFQHEAIFALLPCNIDFQKDIHVQAGFGCIGFNLPRQPQGIHGVDQHCLPKEMCIRDRFYTHAGPEIAVASTKAYSVQLAALYMLCCRMALTRGCCNKAEAGQFMEDLLAVIPAMETMIGRSDQIKSFIRHLIRERDTFFIGRGLDYAFSLEGALKLKEISYIHAEAYAAGELKHGTIALIYDNVPVIAIATQDHVFAKTISNVREVKARGAYVILLAKEQAQLEDGVADVYKRQG